ncbi:MAG: DUF192 domain-containing protein [Rhodocyclaceae bacterium]|nr:DUF192 domain-containing protein [Rhodocyclaceae bacterium]
MSKKLFIMLSALAALATSLDAAAQRMPLVELSAGMYRIEAEVAATEPSRELGLMHRKAMAPQHGMLFVFDAPGKSCMWMRNTLLPLAVAFIDEHGRIINVEEMLPQTDDNHCAAQPAKYALEMNAGWFKTRGFGAGTPIAGIDKAPKAH